MTTKKAVVLGAGGFIGGHLVTRLKKEGYWVRGVDIKRHEHKRISDADEYILADLRSYDAVSIVIDDTIDEVYQLAADMGGAGYIFSGENDAAIMSNSVMINLHVCRVCVEKSIKKVFYSSSACIYPAHNQTDPNNPLCSEESAYPAHPDSEYGWEKLFSERLYLTYHRNHGLNVRIARFHNIFGQMGTWRGGKEKAPAALCRKVIEAVEGGEIEIWGDGQQTRSFLYIDECIEAIRRLMASSDFMGPVNIGSEEMVTIQELAEMIIGISGKTLSVRPLSSSLIVGVRGRNSDNRLLRQQLGYEPTMPLRDGLVRTYAWISRCVQEARQEERFVFESPDNGKTVYRRPACSGTNRCRIV